MKTIISLILIAASIAFFVFFTQPKWNELTQNKLQVEKLNVAADSAKKLKSRIDYLENIRKNISNDDSQKITRMLPDNVENVKLIIDFDNLLQALVNDRGTAALYSGKVGTENPKVIQGSAIIGGNFDNSQLGVADFSFNVSLTYGDFIELLKRIETSTRIFDIDSISFTTPDASSIKDPNNIIYNFSIKLKTYWLKSK
jgi:hypothetical protein